MKSRSSSSSHSSGIRLNKFLASCGLGARRKVEEYVTEGRVTVNGAIVDSLGVKVQEKDEVRVDGRRVKPAPEVTLVLYKPKGFLCSRSGLVKQRLVYELLPEEFQNLNYVGRLDLETRGLLLFTNSGALHQKLTHPSHAVEKEYEVRLDRDFETRLVARLIKGIHLAEGLARAVVARIHPKSPSCLTMVLAQGYNRQVRRMFAALGYKVKELERVRIGGLQGLGLAPGQFKILGHAEISRVTQPSERGTASLALAETARPERPRPPRREGGAGVERTYVSGKLVRGRKPEGRSSSSSRPQRSGPGQGSSRRPPRKQP